MTDVRICRAGPARIAELEVLWSGMHAHHGSMQQDVAPIRPLKDSWRRRRGQYEHWLREGDAQLLIAEHDAQPIGYALVRIEPGPATWDVGDRVAELESLAVAPEARGAGVGAMLIAAARDAARDAGAARLMVAVAHANLRALRFYEREGFEPFYVLLLDRPPQEEDGARSQRIRGTPSVGELPALLPTLVGHLETLHAKCRASITSWRCPGPPPHGGGARPWLYHCALPGSLPGGAAIPAFHGQRPRRPTGPSVRR